MSKIHARGNSTRPPVSRSKLKGWIGFVRSYKDYLLKGNYDDIEWNEDPEDSGAKEIEEKTNGTTIYHF